MSQTIFEFILENNHKKSFPLISNFLEFSNSIWRNIVLNNINCLLCIHLNCRIIWSNIAYNLINCDNILIEFRIKLYKLLWKFIKHYRNLFVHCEIEITSFFLHDLIKIEFKYRLFAYLQILSMRTNLNSKNRFKLRPRFYKLALKHFEFKWILRLTYI